MNHGLIQVGGKSYIKAEVHVVDAHDNSGAISKDSSTGEIGVTLKSSIPNSMNVRFSDGTHHRYTEASGFPHKTLTAVTQHLHFCIDEEIKLGDMWLNTKDPALGVRMATMYDILAIQRKNATHCKKVIATTDSSLFTDQRDFNKGNITYAAYRELVPRPSDAFVQKFVEEYSKGNVITEVLVEYRRWEYPHSGDPDTFELQVAPDNTITIKPLSKKTYSVEQILNLLNDWRKTSGENTTLTHTTFENWCREKL